MSPPFELTERGGRWYGRGAADCKGSIAMHLTALRALGEDIPVHLTLIAEGSEEQGTGGLEDYVPKHAEQLRADAILVCDTGNAAVGRPSAMATEEEGFVISAGVRDTVVVHPDDAPEL